MLELFTNKFAFVKIVRLRVRRRCFQFSCSARLTPRNEQNSFVPLLSKRSLTNGNDSTNACRISTFLRLKIERFARKSPPDQPADAFGDSRLVKVRIFAQPMRNFGRLWRHLENAVLAEILEAFFWAAIEELGALGDESLLLLLPDHFGDGRDALRVRGAAAAAARRRLLPAGSAAALMDDNFG